MNASLKSKESDASIERAIRPAFKQFIRKGEGSGGGSKPNVNLVDQRNDPGRKVTTSLEAQNVDVLRQLDQISRANTNARSGTRSPVVQKAKTTRPKTAKNKAVAFEERNADLKAEEVITSPNMRVTDPNEFQFEPTEPAT